MFFILLQQVHAQLGEVYKVLQLLAGRHAHLAAQIIFDLRLGGQFRIIYQCCRFQAIFYQRFHFFLWHRCYAIFHENTFQQRQSCFQRAFRAPEWKTIPVAKDYTIRTLILGKNLLMRRLSINF